MSETIPGYETARNRPVVSEPHRMVEEVSAHYAMIPDDLLQSGKPSAVAVYGALDRIARGNKTKTSTAISYLANFCQLSSRTVKTALDWLEQEGYIEVHHVGRGREQNTYFLPFRRARRVKSTHQKGNQIGKIYPQTNSYQETSQELSDSFVPQEPEPPEELDLLIDTHVEIKPIRTRTVTGVLAKPKEPPDPRVKLLMEELESARTWKTTRYGAEAKATKAMLKDYEPNEILACYGTLKRDKFWEDKPLYLMTVMSHIGEWSVNRKKGATNGGLPTPRGFPAPDGDSAATSPEDLQRKFIQDRADWVARNNERGVAEERPGGSSRPGLPSQPVPSVQDD